MGANYTFQRNVCGLAVETKQTPILNAACKEDPAKLGKDFNAINFDLMDYDAHTKTKLKDLRNFVQGDILDAAEIFEAEFFGCIVLGEFIEHCVPSAALKALQELARVLKPDGFLALTFPLDGRPKERQHAKHHLKVYLEGESGHDITVWHQTVWTDEMLSKLFEEAGLKETRREELHYGFCEGGWGITLEKR